MPITGLSHYLIQNPILTLFLICHFYLIFTYKVKQLQIVKIRIGNI